MNATKTSVKIVHVSADLAVDATAHFVIVAPTPIVVPTVRVSSVKTVPMMEEERQWLLAIGVFHMAVAVTTVALLHSAARAALIYAQNAMEKWQLASHATKFVAATVSFPVNAVHTSIVVNVQTGKTGRTVVTSANNLAAMSLVERTRIGRARGRDVAENGGM